MSQLMIFLFIINILVAIQCYRNARLKGYPSKVFTILGLVPYFNLVVWVYLLFLPDLSSASKFEPS
ncbi:MULTISPECIES: hypothetical protein [Pseudoalteromonas]|uniref:Cardiolipin synthase N-terminal domain-containing protein n=1 Tax=Pseudoalteromonas amylolytica TaxID=1859457 RepID=A0A1S1MSW3_9GAMM|nr:MULTISPECIES: hypothetical protein [Pseudoalteromonas]MCF6435510.1 hypothetical protein [Pseudoalteromonas sp. MMG022]OHU86328.1 hypothetical protein BFC16_16640 [Pseudoalteromonas sp. JW3]OHU89567.1 hypothetical protein BET10_15680 [Pseudoalteromonas amylolytica]